jgi:hypothetical protein
MICPRPRRTKCRMAELWDRDFALCISFVFFCARRHVVGWRGGTMAAGRDGRV